MSDESNGVNNPAAAANQAMHTGMNTAHAMGQNLSDMGASAMSEFTKLLGSMKMPMMPDMEALMSAHRRNLETLSAANKVALEGAQSIARRNMEMMQQTMAELTEGMRGFSPTEPPQARAARQAEMLKSAYERAVFNMQEISGLIQKSNGEALNLLNQRFTEAVEEVKLLVSKGAQPGV